MSERAEALSQQFQQKAEPWVAAAAALTPSEWRLPGVNAPGITAGEDERRPLGVIVSHMAAATGGSVGTMNNIIAGKPTWMPTLDIDALAEVNARHHAENPEPDQEATVAQLRSAVDAVAARVAELTDAELACEGDAFGNHHTVESFVMRSVVFHGDWHLASINATLAAAGG